MDPDGRAAFGKDNIFGFVSGIKNSIKNTISGIFSMPSQIFNVGLQGVQTGKQTCYSSTCARVGILYQAGKAGFNNGVGAATDLKQRATDLYTTTSPYQTGQIIGQTVGDVGQAFLAKKIGGMSGEGGVGKVSGKVNNSTSFFEGSTYHSRVQSQFKNSKNYDYHTFPEEVRAFESQGTIKNIIDSRGNSVNKLSIPGSYNNLNGEFEFIKNTNNEIYHRFFRAYED